METRAFKCALLRYTSAAAIISDLHFAEHVLQRDALDFRQRRRFYGRLIVFAQSLGCFTVIPLHQESCMTTAVSAAAAAASVTVHAMVMRVCVVS